MIIKVGGLEPLGPIGVYAYGCYYVTLELTHIFTQIYAPVCVCVRVCLSVSVSRHVNLLTTNKLVLRRFSLPLRGLD